MIVASILWWAAAPLGLYRSGRGLDKGSGADVLGNEIGVLAQPIAGSLDLDNDSVVEQSIEERSGDDMIAKHLTPFCEAAV